MSIIHNIISRKALIKKKTPGKKSDFQLIAANVDVAFIVQALDDGIAVYIQKVKMDFRNSTDYELSDEVAYNEEPGKIIGSVFEILKQANRFIRRTEGPTPLYR